MLNKTEIKDKPICENFSEYNDVRKNLNNALSIKDPFNHWAFDKVLPKDLVDRVETPFIYMLGIESNVYK